MFIIIAMQSKQFQDNVLTFSKLINCRSILNVRMLTIEINKFNKPKFKEKNLHKNVRDNNEWYFIKGVLTNLYDIKLIWYIFWQCSENDWLLINKMLF